LLERFYRRQILYNFRIHDFHIFMFLQASSSLRIDCFTVKEFMEILFRIILLGMICSNDFLKRMLKQSPSIIFLVSNKQNKFLGKIFSMKVLKESLQTSVSSEITGQFWINHLINFSAYRYPKIIGNHYNKFSYNKKSILKP
jgi:hypothetical protein